jgi:ComF family protein
VGEAGVLCAGCRKSILADDGRRCLRCAALIGRDALEEGCPECRRSPGFRFGAAVTLGGYEGGLRDLVMEFKYRRAYAAGRQLARELARKVRARGLGLKDPVLVAAPMHWWKRLKRGFNQSAALADWLSRDLGWPWARGALAATRPVADQVGLMRPERRRNVEDAFRVARPDAVSRRDVVLVDDVLTTGATLNECARMVRKAGAKSVSAVFVARTRTD